MIIRDWQQTANDPLITFHTFQCVCVCVSDRIQDIITDDGVIDFKRKLSYVKIVTKQRKLER